ncbi:unnamed protein product [Onchocerca ochengi]|uniref:4Fe-4S ferredoxin-type domain-containing protein n=1 Tax=Onchocerca ochengi TaxID=42157 RepID=A0A182DYZ7_ONCOC|nr:unnamed protein product [Onchocerca ochengi]
MDGRIMFLHPERIHVFDEMFMSSSAATITAIKLLWMQFAWTYRATMSNSQQQPSLNSNRLQCGCMQQCQQSCSMDMQSQLFSIVQQQQHQQCMFYCRKCFDSCKQSCEQQITHCANPCNQNCQQFCHQQQQQQQPVPIVQQDKQAYKPQTIRVDLHPIILESAHCIPLCQQTCLQQCNLNLIKTRCQPAGQTICQQNCDHRQLQQQQQTADTMPTKSNDSVSLFRWTYSM